MNRHIRNLESAYRELPHHLRLASGMLLQLGVWLWLVVAVALPNSSWAEWGGIQRVEFGLDLLLLMAVFYYHGYDLLPRQMNAGKPINYLLMTIFLVVFFEVIHRSLVNDLLMMIVWSEDHQAYLLQLDQYQYWLPGMRGEVGQRFPFWLITFGWGWGRYGLWYISVPAEKKQQLPVLRLQWTLHVLFWAFLVATNWELIGILDYNLIESAAVILMAVVFYGNYFLLRRWQWNKNWPYYLLQFVLLLALAWPLDAWLNFLNANRGWDGAVSENYRTYWDIFFNLRKLTFWIAVVLSWIYYFFERNVAEKTIALRTESESRRAELSHLKTQIQPHFLLNVINGLYAEALEEDSPKTAAGIVQLSQLLQYTVYETDQPRVALDQELNFLYQYIQLQKRRLPEQIKVQVKWPTAPFPEEQIAPLLLLAPVENAFKHGVSLQHPSFIEIALRVEDKAVHLLVVNPLHPQREQQAEVQPGIGLDNMKKRLEILYPRKHHLEISRKNGEFRVDLKIML
ncbi:sensor histidine kinase [Flavilitoribacter nigricans]|uniref:Signal transduction histidine kinase internal region domain-containing protein n=1 Tax=Flavilitoribacter nigricans (strain ATCC 23147 / DSM 23189 / NBRC 102662 / NCIMB 1420 / SS-2) TaxID=1122177 RepID=A0A2D0N6V6_FLAN2|nr:histidine kinase [Flavilitoribacter nigricans]PHN04120.1 hypothetical protein CRP01_23270 [Flavilitoribacter nigricans DSM 23189 = NBRC 102662]